jgi:hypothetical protein
MGILKRVRTIALGVIIGAALSLGVTARPAEASVNQCQFCEWDCPANLSVYCGDKGCWEGQYGCWEASGCIGQTVFCNLF